MVLDDAALRADPAVARLDPDLDSLTNVNTPAEYAAARARPPAPVVVEHAGSRTPCAPPPRRGAGRGGGAPLGGPRTATRSPRIRLPLVAGDALVLR
jgi:molybdopterin-guanine dinucleotide biosynthesis protein A